MAAYTPLFISDDWSYGELFEGFLKNLQAPLPDWLVAREHIRTVFFRLHSMFLPELIKATNTFIPFRPVHPHPSRDESPLDLERRSHFLTTAFFHAVCDAVDVNLPAYRENPAALLMVSRELPRLRALLGAIQCIVWAQPKQSFESHFTAPSEAFTRPAVHNVEDSLQHLDLEQLAVTINLLGGWDMAKLAVDAHFHLKHPSLPRPLGFPSAEELKERPNVENLAEKEAVRALEASLAKMRIEKRRNARVSSDSEYGTSDTYRQRNEKVRRESRRTQRRVVKSNDITAAISEFNRLAKSFSNSDNSSGSSFRSEGSSFKLAPIGSKRVWERNGCDSSEEYGNYSSTSSSISSLSPPPSGNRSQSDLDVEWTPLFDSLAMKKKQRKATKIQKESEQSRSKRQSSLTSARNDSSVWSDSNNDEKASFDYYFNVNGFPSL